MADETPEPETTAPDEAAAPAQAPEPAADAGPKRTPKEERAHREHLARSQRPPRTPQERDAERRERRRAKAVARTRRRQQEKAKRAAGPKGTGTPPAARPPSSPQERQGTVVSAKADKTITVRIDISRRHRRYQKIVRSTSTVHAHDETNDASEGDKVRVVESRPLSATKRWRLVEVMERAK